MPNTYINPLTDFGFKKLFGEESNKDLLISLLNTLLPERHQIADLQYTKNEYQGVGALDRRAIFDLNCVSTTGERFIIELQKAKQRYFKDRSVYYSTFAIQEQAKQGDWDYKLSTVYTITILDFLIDEQEHEVFHYVAMKDQHNRPFFDKLHFIYVVLPRFGKGLDELSSLQDKWLYTLRHLAELQEQPNVFSEGIFRRLFALAALAQFDPKDRQRYEDSLKYLRDLKNSEETARLEGELRGRLAGRQEGLQEGMEKGLESGKLEVARNLLDVLDDDTIAAKTGLPCAAVAELRAGQG